MIGLLLLKHIYGLSDEGVCERWVYDPYFQYFTGEEFFQHAFPHERSDLSHWRKRLGDKLELLLAESLRVAHERRRVAQPGPQAGHGRHHGAAQGHHLPDRRQAAACGDQGTQPPGEQARRAVAAILPAHRQGGRDDGGALCPRQAVQAPPSAIAHPAQPARPDHPRHPPQDRRPAGDRAAFALPLGRATQIRSQQQRQRGWKLYSFHAPEVECIGKGKASAPYEFGVKASIVTTNRRAPGGQFVLHAKALPGNPYDGHTLRDVIEDTERLTGCAIERAYVDKGYRGHGTENPRRVFISGQKRGVFGVIKRELRRRSAIEPMIGHLKAEGHLGRCYLKGRAGDAANAILSAVGHNFRRILAWLRDLLRFILAALIAAISVQSALKSAS